MSDIAHLVKGNLITHFPITNRLWVTLPFGERQHHHLFIWPTGSEWHCTFCKWQPSHHSWLTASKWHLWNPVLSHLFPWSTASEWHSTFLQPCHIFSYDQQHVSDIACFVEGSHVTPFSMTNRRWVTLHMLWKAPSLIKCFPPTHSKYVTLQFCGRQSHHIFFPMINRKWVTLHMLWKAPSLIVWSHIFLQHTASKWHCNFVEGSLIPFFPMINRKWVILHMLLMAVSPHLFLWLTESKWHCIHCERLSHQYLFIASKWHCTCCES